MGKDKEVKKSSIPSSSFDAATTATAANAAPADDAEAPAKKEYIEEETTDRTARGNGLFYALAATVGGGGGLDGSQAKAAAGSFRIGPYLLPITSQQDKTKQKKNKGRERELVYSSFSTKKEE